MRFGIVEVNANFICSSPRVFIRPLGIIWPNKTLTTGTLQSQMRTLSKVTSFAKRISMSNKM